MWPHFFKCGSKKKAPAGGSDRGASMWPHFFKCGSSSLSGAVIRAKNGFNVAALFQVRKFQFPGQARTGPGKASMWPHFFKCGSISARVCPRRKSTTLQCGRTFSSAEVFDADLHESMGFQLQCGRTFSSAEVLAMIASPIFSSPASMWPHFFKCGSRIFDRRTSGKVFRFNVAALFQVRKCPRARIMDAQLRRFNVAALFQVRK